MRIQRNVSYQPSFMLQHTLKTLYIRGHFPQVKKDIYGNELTKKNVTLEHILPRSKGGADELSNLALSVGKPNWKRGNAPFSSVYNKENAEEYYEQFKHINLPNFNGTEYGESLQETIKKVIEED